jgi:hypothetical protein
MMKISYQARIFFLGLIITLAPWQPLSAAIKQSTDDKGTICITNPEDKNKPPIIDHAPPKAPTPPAQPQKSEAVKPQEPAPSNIFPKKDADNDDEESTSPDDDD